MLTRLVLTLTLLLVFSSACSSAIAMEEICQALVTINNDLWIVNTQGMPIERLTFNGEKKFSAAWSPDGRTIAYTALAPARLIILIDRHGGLISESVVEHRSVTSVTSIGWADPNLLWYKGHGGPQGSVFEFWELPLNLNLINRKVLAEASGIHCVLSPNHQYVTCEEEDGLRINDNFIYPMEIKEAEKREDGKRILEGGLAWDAQSQRLATVERTKLGRLLVILKTAAGEKDQAVGWSIIKIPLPTVAEPIGAIRFSTNGGSVTLEGESHVYKVNTDSLSEPVVSSQPAPGRSLPRRLGIHWEGQNIEVDVFDWHCV